MAAGYGLYRGGTVIAPAGRAEAGVRNRFVVSAFLAENREWVAGEFRYTYQDGDPFLRRGGLRTDIQGESHAFHFDFVVFLADPQRWMRPFVAAGLGAKLYGATGPENPEAPLQAVARLRANDHVTFVATAGGGVKIRLGRGLLLRLEFRDYATPFPKRLIAPAPQATARGIFHQFTPLAGLSYVFSPD
ncbi:MAG: hypothetical protein RMK57_02265 [Bryobacterales bacterium]|nr:hypothetical protein [Bryobacteraceae bacterium]MDW8353330.1 hypothetical protein [Bryobacterales bacterium]